MQRRIPERRPQKFVVMRQRLRALALATAVSVLLVGLVTPFRADLRVLFTRERCVAPNESSVWAPKMAQKILSFPPSFLWGTATASYQIEGAANEDRQPSIWDRFSNTPGKTANGETGLNACDHYHRYKEDVQLMKKLNTKYYRFSIAWPRIQKLENGVVEVNEAGVAFYNALIDELLANGITPFVTLYHWDLPLWVQDSTGGWAGSTDIARRFADYARVCFDKFGDRVKEWITLNEPWCSAVLGYETGEHAPGDTSRPGDAVYKAGHNLLLAHAKAVEVYRTEFQKKQGGKIGVTLNSNWAEPWDKEDEESVRAAQHDLDFELGWFADPIWKGDYPESMREAVGERLPNFSEEEKNLLKGSSDFFGLNHYSSQYSKGFWDGEARKGDEVSFWKDRSTTQEFDKKWKKTDMGWAIVPWGFRNLLLYISKTYQPKGGIIVTENGLASREGNRKEMEKDTLRIEFYKEYIQAVHQAIAKGGDVRGYFLWSLMDNFEWSFGYAKRFGLYWVDYETMERVPKPAAGWYANVIANNAVDIETCAKDAEL